MSGNDMWEAEADAKMVQGEEPNTIFSRFELSAMAVIAFVSMMLGTLGAVQLVYGTLQPELTLTNVLMIPLAVIVMVVMGVVWLMLIAGLIDALFDLWERVTNSEGNSHD